MSNIFFRTFLNSIQRKSIWVFSIVFGILCISIYVSHSVSAATTWNQPSCNPDTDPTAANCLVSAPLNVSTATQIKQGKLTIQDTVTAGQLILDEALGGGNGSVSIKTDSTAAAAISINHYGSSNALEVFQNGAATSAYFENMASNTTNVVQVKHSGTGGGISVTTNAGTGVTAASATGTGISATGATGVSTRGTTRALDAQSTAAAGQAGYFLSQNTTNAGVLIQNTSTGKGLAVEVGGVSVGTIPTLGGWPVATQEGIQVATPGSFGVMGYTTNTTSMSAGVYGRATSGYGVIAYSSSGTGIYATTLTSAQYGGTLCYTNSGVATNCASLGGGTYAGSFAGRLNANASVTNNPVVQVTNTNTTANPGYGIRSHTMVAGGFLSVQPVTQGTAIDAQAYNGFGVNAYSVNSYALNASTPSGLALRSESTKSDGVGIEGRANTGANSVGIQGYGARGVYGESTVASSGTGGSFKGPDGVYAESTLASSGTGGKFKGPDGVYGEATSASGVGGRFKGPDGIYAESTSASNANGAKFKGPVGVFGESTGNAGVSGLSNYNGQSGVYGNSTFTDGSGGYGYGVYGQSTSGVGVYGAGPLYAGQFVGDVLTQGRSIANQHIDTQRTRSALGDVGFSSYSTTISDTLLNYYKNMVFDGSEVWTVTTHATTSTNNSVQRYDPEDMAKNREWKPPSTEFINSELIKSANPTMRGVYFWNTVGDTYFFPKNSGSAVKLNMTGGTLMTNVKTGIDTGRAVFVGRDGNLGISYSTDMTGLTTTSTSTTVPSFTAVSVTAPITVAWGTVIDMVMDANQVVYALHKNSSNNYEVLKITASGSTYTVSGKYDISTSTKAAKYITYDGKYIWVTLDNTASTYDTVGRIDPSKSTGYLTEFYLTDNGTSTGNIYCSSPLGIEFDGSFIWVSCNANNTGSTYRYGFVRVSPSTGQLVKFDESNYQLTFNGATAGTFVQPANNIIFDGTYMWMVGKDPSIRKYFSGQGEGDYGRAWATKGINLFTNDGSVRCLRVADGALPGSNTYTMLYLDASACGSTFTQR